MTSIDTSNPWVYMTFSAQPINDQSVITNQKLFPTDIEEITEDFNVANGRVDFSDAPGITYGPRTPTEIYLDNQKMKPSDDKGKIDPTLLQRVSIAV